MLYPNLGYCFGKGNAVRRVVQQPIVDNPFPADKMSEYYESLAQAIVAATPFDKGYCLDLGCGDGRIVITAAKKYSTRGVGIDIVPERIEESIKGAEEAGVRNRVKFRLGDATKMDFSEATVVDREIAGFD